MDGEEGGTASCTGPALSPMRRSPEGRSRACPPQPEGPQTSPLDSTLSRDHRDGSIQVSASEVRVGRGHVVTRRPSKWPERGCPFLPSWSICRREAERLPGTRPPSRVPCRPWFPDGWGSAPHARSGRRTGRFTTRSPEGPFRPGTEGFIWKAGRGDGACAVQTLETRGNVPVTRGDKARKRCAHVTEPGPSRGSRGCRRRTSHVEPAGAGGDGRARPPGLDSRGALLRGSAGQRRRG